MCRSDSITDESGFETLKTTVAKEAWAQRKTFL